MKIFKEVFELGNRQVTIETGGIARQATSAVTVTIGETVVLVTSVAKKEVKPGMDFFPLTINYQEKAYAAGKIPGGFPRREGRPANHETLTARLIDRPLRPLFPKGFHNEVQIVATVLSFDPEVPADIPALIGASASLALSGVPFDGPVGGVRVGFIDGKYIINPSHEEMLTSELDLVVAGTKDAVLMVESEAECLPEEVMLGSVLYGHEQMQTIIEAIAQLKKHAGKPAWKWETPLENKALKSEIKQKFYSEIAEAYSFTEKQKRNESLAVLKTKILETMLSDTEDDIELDPSDILGDEDHLGDMDFKVAGTEHGITALQMDIKIKGITRDIMAAALDQAKEGRIHILGIMNEELSKPRVELSPHAPQMRTIKVLPNKVRDIIGKGGATIKALAQDTGASVDVSDDGSVKIFAKTRESLETAITKIEAITADVENGKTYDGTVVKLMDFGVFINLMPGKDGLLHISEMGDGIDSPEGVYSEGDKVSVTVVNVDRQGKIKLSLAASQ